MAKILYWINNIEPLNDLDLMIFLEYNIKIQHLPIGTERLSYNKEFLLSEDSKLDDITSNYKNEIIEKCIEIIQALGTKS